MKMPSDLPGSWPPGYPLHRPLSTREAALIDDLASSRHDLPGLVLMEHASRGVAEIVDFLCEGAGTILCLCGPGNNGGDGYGAARFLRSWGRSVEVLRCAPQEPAPGAARVQFERVLETTPVGAAFERPEVLLRALDRGPTLVLDALFGVGLRRSLKAPFEEWIQAINAADCLRVAVDVPSGLNADTGEPLPICVQAHVTATMAAPKTGFQTAHGACGHVVEVDIGLPAALHEAYLLGT